MHNESPPNDTSIKRLAFWQVTGRNAVILGLLSALLIGAGAALFWPRSPSLPSAITSQTHFPVYYPESLPHGYRYETNSAHQTNGIIFFNLRRGKTTQRMFISEQVVPTAPPALESLVGFKNLKVDSGTAVTGTANGLPTAILMNSTTLITVTGSSSIPQSTVNTTAQNMQQLSQK